MDIYKYTDEPYKIPILMDEINGFIFSGIQTKW